MTTPKNTVKGWITDVTQDAGGLVVRVHVPITGLMGMADRVWINAWVDVPLRARKVSDRLQDGICAGTALHVLLAEALEALKDAGM